MDLEFYKGRLLPTGKGQSVILEAMVKHNINPKLFVPEEDLILITEYIVDNVETSNHRNQMRLNTTGDVLNYMDYLKNQGED